MSFGLKTGFKPSEEDEKKRREKFAANAPRLGMVPNTAADTPASSNANAPKLGMAPNLSDKTIADEYNSTTVVGSDNVWKGNPDKKSFGLSVMPAPDHQPSMNAASSNQGNRGFRMPRPPGRFNPRTRDGCEHFGF